MSYLEDEMFNPLGFTKEVEVLLSGLGCSKLTSFKNKNISLNDLKYLTNEDLIQLSIDDNFDHKSFTKLQFNLKKTIGIINKPRVIDVIHILNNNRKQLEVINIYMEYLNKQLKNIPDFFIDKNKNFKLSKALVIISQDVVQEIKNLNVAITAMQMKKQSNINNK